jgi:sigma-E factor negative regulatory protein RseB
MRWRFTALIFLGFGFMGSAACAAEDDTAVQWLQKIANATHELNYRGNFVYQHGSHMETSQIIHMVDANGEHEKLTVIDGAPREVYRDNERVLCFLPDKKTVVVERRNNKKSFPSILPSQIADLSHSYAVKLGPQERIADHDCQIILLEPKDNYRYGHKLWADLKTGLLLKSGTMSEDHKMVEQFAFTHVSIGGKINIADVNPKLEGMKLIGVDSADKANEPVDVNSGWTVNNLPPGFQKIMEVQRVFPNKTDPVTHIVYSDGLAAVSVFVESATFADEEKAGLSNHGAIHIYSTHVGNSNVRVVGEVPGATVMQIANSLSNTK